MSWKNLLTTVACFTSCATLYSAPVFVATGDDLNAQLLAGTPSIAFMNTIQLAPTTTQPILFPMGSTPALVPTANAMTIDGMGNTLLGNPTYRGFFALGTGTLIIQNMIIESCTAQGGAGGQPSGGGGLGAGGAIYVASGANLTLNNISIQSCNATGGAGGSATNPHGGGGGGGLLGAGGAGGTQGTNPAGGGGGGGGGFAWAGGNGGTGDSNAGGGGGGGTESAGAIGTGSGGTGGSSFAATGGTGGAGSLPGNGDPGNTGPTGTGAGGGGWSLHNTPGAGGAGLIGGGGGGGGGMEDGVNITGGTGGLGGKYGGSGGGGASAAIALVGSNTGGTGGGAISNFGGGGGGGGEGFNSNIAGENGFGGAGGVGGFGAGGGGGGQGNGNSCHGGTGGAGGFGGTAGGDVSGVCGAAGAGGNGASFGGGIFIEAGGTLTLSGTAAISGNTLGVQTGASQLGIDIFMMSSAQLTFNNTNTLPLTNPIESDNTAGGGSPTIGGITISNTGTIDFTGIMSANTYTGSTTISNGILIISNDNQLGAATNPLNMTAIAANPTLEIQGAVTLNATRPINFSGTGTSTFLINTGSLGVSGPIALGTGNLAVNTVAAGATCTLSGLISGTTSTLTKSGAGTLTLNGTMPNTYTGTTIINAGTMDLDSTGNAIIGPIHLNAGILELSASGQTKNTVDMTINGGTFAMGTFTTSLDSLTFNSGGTVTQGAAATLTLASAGQTPAALTMQGGTTIPGPLDFSSATSFIVFDPAVAGTANINGTVNLGGGNTTFNIGISTAPEMIVSGAISNGSITLADLTGTLQFTGTAANTYSGTTTVSSGTLELNKTMSMFAIPGNTTINGGTVLVLAADQIAHTSNMLLSSGTFNMQTFPIIMNSLVFDTGATLIQASPAATLTLGSTGSTPAALTMQGGTTISQPLILTGTNPFVVFDATNNGTASINSGVTLGSGTNTWNIGHLNGGPPVDMVVSGPITGAGSFTKIGPGLLNLTGASSFVGPTAINAGTLAVNGTMTADVTVAFGATLQGTGTVFGTVDASGTVSPGNSIGTLTVGSTIMGPTSTHLNEITPTTTDLLIVNGTYTIEPGATFALSPAMAFYDPDSIFKVIETTGGVTGEFTNFTKTFPFVAKLFYTTNDVFLEVDLGEFGGVLPKGNCHEVAVALDQIFDGGNPLDPIFVSLLGIPLNQLCNAVNQMQPSLFKGLAIVQQNNALLVNNALGYRFQNVLDDMYCSRQVDSDGILERQECRPDEEFFHIWVDGFGDFSHQKNNHYADSPQIGYGNTTGGVVEGFDFHFADYYYLGALAAATRSNIHWNSHKGKGHISSTYGGLYASAIGTLCYVNTSAMWSWNHYDAHRNIVYPGTNRRAHNSHNGNQFFAHLDTGLNFRVGNFILRPFDAVDYITQQEHQYKEHGAGSFNLTILGNRLRMVRNELGLNFARCVCLENGTFTVDGKLSWVYEARLKGRKTTSRFQGTTPHFTVISYYKSRSLFSPGLTLSYKNDLYDITAYYDGEFTTKYWDQSVGLQIGFDF